MKLLLALRKELKTFITHRWRLVLFLLLTPGLGPLLGMIAPLGLMQQYTM
jgi:hypothetical protein